MKIAFVNYTPLIYTVETPYSAPLGGSESAMCYLAEALAKRGHEIFLYTRINEAQNIRGVMHLPDGEIRKAKDLDVLIIQNTPFCVTEIQPYLNKKTKVILWLEHAHDQPAVSCLNDKNIVNLYSSIIFISQWQKQQFLANFPLGTGNCFILRNAISPAFENLFLTGEKISIKKIQPPVIAYTSTPFRGLNRLLKIFPIVRNEFPDVRLQVFSSMKVYQQNQTQDEKDFGDLYEQCRKTAGIELIGSLSQSQLAQRLKPVSILAYPSTFLETGCTSVLEAMSAGCQIITSDLGALPETSSGFGKLIDFRLSEDEYLKEFAAAIIESLRKIYSHEFGGIDDVLTRQVYFTNQAYNWKKRAQEWEFFLQNNVLN